MTLAAAIDRAHQHAEKGRAERARTRERMPCTGELVDAFRAAGLTIRHIRGQEGPHRVETGRTPNRATPRIPGVHGQGDVTVVCAIPPKGKG